MICIDLDGVLCPFKIVSPLLETVDNSSQFLIIDLPVPLSVLELPRHESD